MRIMKQLASAVLGIGLAGWLFVPIGAAGFSTLAGTPALAGVAVGDSVLRGTIRSEGVRDDGVLPGALVEVRQAGRVHTVTSDDQGRYRVTGLEPGPAHVYVFHLVAHPLRLEIRMPPSGEMTLDLELEKRTLELEPVLVRSLPVRVRPVSTRTARMAPGAVVAIRGLDATTGMVESGLVGVVGRMPGDDEPAPDQVLYMRGSTVDARTVLLDGAPILTPFHVAGLVPPFESDLVDDAHLYLGGAPSRFGGGLSYLLDVGTRLPRTKTVRGGVAADGLLLKGSVEAPLPGDGAVLLAGRAIHGLQNRLEAGDDFPYGYEDILFRSGIPLGGGHTLSFTGYRNEEEVRLDEVLLDGGQARWGNRVSSLRWTGPVGPALVQGVAARSRYDATLPLEWPEPVLARASSGREHFGLDARVPTDGRVLLFGLSADRIDFAYRLDPGRSRAQAETVIREDRAAMGTTVLGGYAEVETPLSDRLDARAGIRMEHFSGTDGLRVGPRASVRLLVTDAAALTVAAGRYHQALPQPGLASTQAEDGSPVLGWNSSLPVASSTHLVLGLDQMLDEHIRLDVSGFVKAFEGMVPGSAARVNASGTDLRVARGGERMAGWLGYALSWFWEGEPGARSSTFSGRHLVSAGARGWLTERLEVGVSVGYGAGLPLAAVALSQPAEDSGRSGGPTLDGFDNPTFTSLSTGTGGTAPLEPANQDEFLRVDLELAWDVAPTLGGRTTHLRPYLRILNALDSRDALFHYFERWREGDIRPVAERPFLPLLGLEWRF